MTNFHLRLKLWGLAMLLSAMLRTHLKKRVVPSLNRFEHYCLSRISYHADRKSAAYAEEMARNEKPLPLDVDQAGNTAANDARKSEKGAA